MRPPPFKVRVRVASMVLPPWPVDFSTAGCQVRSSKFLITAQTFAGGTLMVTVLVTPIAQRWIVHSPLVT